MFTYTVKPHPSRENYLLVTTPKPSHYRCETDTELALLSIGGTFARRWSQSGQMAYSLSPAMVRDLALILDAGFLPLPYGDGFYRSDICEAGSCVERYLSRKEALAFIDQKARCTRTLELDFTTAPEPEPEPEKHCPYRVAYCPVQRDFKREAVNHYASAIDAVEAAMGLYRAGKVPRVSCKDFTLLPHAARARYQLGDNPRLWSFSSPARGIYKSLATLVAEDAGISYRSHRRGYQASNRAVRAFARSWQEQLDKHSL